MRLKRLGPSAVPAEVVLLPEVLDDLVRNIKAPIDGMSARG